MPCQARRIKNKKQQAALIAWQLLSLLFMATMHAMVAQANSLRPHKGVSVVTRPVRHFETIVPKSHSFKFMRIHDIQSGMVLIPAPPSHPNEANDPISDTVNSWIATANFRDT
jgi:hypothetical protein